MKAKLKQECRICSSEITLEKDEQLETREEGFNILYYINCPVCTTEIFIYKRNKK